MYVGHVRLGGIDKYSTSIFFGNITYYDKMSCLERSYKKKSLKKYQSKFCDKNVNVSSLSKIHAR